MKVAELRALLERLPDDREIFIASCCCGGHCGLADPVVVDGSVLRNWGPGVGWTSAAVIVGRSPQ